MSVHIQQKELALENPELRRRSRGAYYEFEGVLAAAVAAERPR